MVDDGGRIDAVTAQDVGVVRARQALNLGKAIQDRIGRRLDPQRNVIGDLADATQRRELQVRDYAEAIALVCHPIEAGHAVHFVLGIAADKDVVAAFTDELVEATAAEEYVVAGNIICQARVEVIAGGAVLRALLDPVVAVAAHLLFVDLGAEDEVIALAGEDLRNVFGGDDEIVTRTAEDQVDARRRGIAGLDDVVTVAALQIVVAALVGDDVITGATEDDVVAETALERVVAFIAIEGVVADAGNEDVVAGGAAEHDVVFAGVLQIVGIEANRIWVVANHEWCDLDVADENAARGIGAAVVTQAGMLLRWITLECPSGNLENLIG